MENLRNRLNTLKINISFIKTSLLHTIHFITGFLLGGISFAGGISPFATGFTAGVPVSVLLSSAAGAAIGYGIFFEIFDALRFICAVFLICLIRLGLDSRIDKNKSMITSAFFAFIITFCTSLCIFLAVGENSTFIIMSFCESLISSAFTCFTVRTLSLPKKTKSNSVLTSSDTIAAVFFCSILLLSLERFSFFGFSPARFIAFFVIMLFSLSEKGISTSVAGICCALTLGFNEEHPQLMSAFILCGISSGIAGIHGKIPTAMSIVLSNLLAVILKGNPDTAIIAISEAVASSILFAVIPKNILIRTISAVSPASKSFEAEKNDIIGFTLKRSSKAIKDISQSVEAVSDFLIKAENSTEEKLWICVKEDICKECGKYDFCWNKCKNITQKAFLEAQDIIKKNEHLISDELPERISLICRSTEKLTDSFNRIFYARLSRIVAENEIRDIKKAAAKSFSCVGTMVENISKSIEIPVKQDREKESVLTAFFSDKGFTVKGLIAQKSLLDKSCVQLYCETVPPVSDMELLLEQMYEATGINYLPPVADEYSKEGTVLSFCEESTFDVDFNIASHTGANEHFSGDTAKCFFDGTGYFYAILSDGMGSGAKAAVDSVMTCSLISRLMRSGFSPENAMETVNCALLMKSSDETLSTLDILRFSLETGKAEFFKAGAAFSVIKKAEKTLVVEKSSIPLGILSETQLQKNEIILGNNDFIFIISDGAAVISPSDFKKLIRDNKNSSAKELSKKAVEEAIRLSSTGKHDDITVICIKIKSN